MSKPQRTVLVIDGSPENCERYRHKLRQDDRFTYEVIADQYSLPTLTQYASIQIDGILLDLAASDRNALSVLDRLRAALMLPSPPLIVVGEGETDQVVRAFKQGAADYLVRDRTTAEDLRAALRSAIENAELKRQLQKSQERFQTSVESLMDCFGIFSALRDQTGQIVDFRIDYLNEAACKNNRMSRAQQVGRGLCEVLPGHRESGLFDAYCQLVETGDPVIKDSVMYEDTYGGQQQVVRAFDIRATRLDDGFVASWRDITDRKQTEHALNRTVTALQVSQQRYQELAELMPQMVWTADATGLINYWNSRWYKYTGLSAGQSMGWESLAQVPEKLRDRIRAQWQQGIATGEPFEFELRLRRWDGQDAIGVKLKKRVKSQSCLACLS